MFDPVRYQKRKMIEWIFGAEEPSNRRPRCRYKKRLRGGSARCSL